MVDENERATIKRELLNEVRREILDPIMVAIASSHEETNALVTKCIGDQVDMRTAFGNFSSRLESLEVRGSGWDQRFSGAEGMIRDGVAEARRVAEDTKVEMSNSLVAAGRRHDELAHKCDVIHDDVVLIKTNIKDLVGAALKTHVDAIAKAADKLSRTPQVRTAASVGGAFAGSALISVIFEIIHHM